jgi:hypothetical protein
MKVKLDENLSSQSATGIDVTLRRVTKAAFRT